MKKRKKRPLEKHDSYGLTKYTLLPNPKNRDKYLIAAQTLIKAFIQNTKHQKITQISSIIYITEFK